MAWPKGTVSVGRPEGGEPTAPNRRASGASTPLAGPIQTTPTCTFGDPPAGSAIRGGWTTAGRARWAPTTNQAGTTSEAAAHGHVRNTSVNGEVGNV